MSSTSVTLKGKMRFGESTKQPRDVMPESEAGFRTGASGRLYKLIRFPAPQAWVESPAQGKLQSPPPTLVLPSETASPQKHSRPYVTANRGNLAARQKAPQLSTVMSSAA